MIGRYRAILFDWDGTLVDTEHAILAAHNHVRAHFNLEPFANWSFFGRGAQSTRELYPIMYGDRAAEAEAVLYRYVDAHHLDVLTPYDDSYSLLERLETSDMLMGVVSNKRGGTLRAEVNHLRWNRFFHCVVGAGDAEQDKPAAAPILLAISQLSQTLAPQDVLYVGDTETDLKSARAAGCDVALLRRGRDVESLIETYKPNYVYDNFSSFPEILEKSDCKICKKNT